MKTLTVLTANIDGKLLARGLLQDETVFEHVEYRDLEHLWSDLLASKAGKVYSIVMASPDGRFVVRVT